MKKLQKEFRGKVVLRTAEPKKAGPVITDNGNFILDVDFGVIEDPAALQKRLQDIPGIVATGLFIGMTECVYIGEKDGTVTKMQRK